MTLFLPELDSRKQEIDFRPDCDVKMSGSSLTGRVLAGRFKILKKIDVDSFKAHDLVLDQIVTVRQALLASQRVDDTWRQKVQQLALVRNPNFLNVLYVVSDELSYFVITEPPQGQSIADQLKERSRFDVEDVLALMTPLAGALDLAASFACCANSISARWLFVEKRHSFAVDSEQRRLSEWALSFVKMDVWELVRPRKNIEWPFPTSKAQSGGSKGLAVRQAALLTYELLGGEKKKREGELKRWFKPVNGLGDAANAILYTGLQGSPLFERSGCFFETLKSAIPSGKGGLGALHTSALQTREHPVALPSTQDVIRRFNRDTAWLAMGVLGALVFATLLVAVKERSPRPVDLTQETRQAEGNLLLNGQPGTQFTVVDLNEKGSNGKTLPEQAPSVDHSLTKISPQEDPSPGMETAAFTRNPVEALTPKINHPDVQANANSWSSANWQDSARVIRPKVHALRSKSSLGPRSVDVKMRLIALWHQSLVRSERSRNWTLFSNLDKREKKKVGYTAEANEALRRKSALQIPAPARGVFRQARTKDEQRRPGRDKSAERLQPNRANK
jgi:hypothetical protein